MFTPDFYIDAIQNSKKQFVNTFVKHDGIKDALNAFVDGQTEYTKAAAKVGVDVSTKLFKETTATFSEASKYFTTK